MRTTVLVALVLLTLVMPGLVGTGLAAPIPEYFEGAWVGFVCVTALPPGSAATSVLVQYNFDKTLYGGIPLGRADGLFAYLKANLGLLSPIIGSNPQVTCSLTPSEVLVQFPGATALQAARQVSGTFQQLGFSRYVIVDTYLSFNVLYLGSVDTLKSDVFLVVGNDDLSYAATHESAESLVP